MLTSTLSGFRSAWRMLTLRMRLKPKNSCWAYARVAFKLIPISLPNFFKTSRKLMLRDFSIMPICLYFTPYLRFSKTIHRWPLCSKYRSSRIKCFLSSGSACDSLWRMSISLRPAFFLSEESVLESANILDVFTWSRCS